MSLGLTAIGASAQQTLEEATDSVRQIYVRAQAGAAADQNEVGGWFYRGRHVPQNYETALQWWARAAQQGNALAIGNMALCYQTGHGVEADSVRAVRLYDRSLQAGNPQLFRSMEASASQGNVFAATYMAHCYKEGIGTRRDNDKQMEYLTIAADHGSVPSRTQLGLLCYNKRDYVQAFNNFSMAAERNDVNATYFTGLLLLEGKGVGQNATEGVNYLMRAERRGHTRAIYRLGRCYATGEGVARNPEQAARNYALAAANGLANANWALGECYVNGFGVPMSYDRATYYFARTLESRGYNTKFSRYATDSLAGTPYETYLKGLKAYESRNFNEAEDLFKELSRENHTEGELWQGMVRVNPSNSDGNVKKGIKNIRKAAEEGNIMAMYILGGLYEAGRGVDQNSGEALNLFKQSAEAGYGPAQCLLADIYYEGRGVARNYDEAVRWYQAAQKSGQLTPTAAQRLAECYSQGLGGLTVDNRKAEKLREGNYNSNTAELLRLI